MDSINIINLFTLSLIWVKIYSNNPSTLEYTPPNVPVPNSNSISGIISLAVSDLNTSLHKSFSFVKFNYIIFPYFDISPVAFTSVSLYPQNSQLKLIINDRTTKCQPSTKTNNKIEIYLNSTNKL